MKKFSLLVSGLATVTMITGAILMFSAVSADSKVDEISVTIETACTMTGTGMNSHTATINPGTYQADIGITTLKAFCNDANGFAIYAAGYTGDEIGGANSTKLVNSAASTNNTINTGTDTTGTISNWAMKLNTNSSDTYPITLDNSFGSYHVVPASYTKVAHRDSATDVGNNATGSTLTTTYAAAVASTQAPGTYAGKVIYTLVHPSSEMPLQPVACDAGKICYNPNTATAVGQMGKKTIYGTNTVVLYAPNFKRDGYGFAGWNTEYDYSGTTYGPNQTIAVPADIQTNGLPLYAIWIKSAGTLQNWSGCSGMNIGDVTALTDNRDNDTYAVAKLADGKCWMIENLRLADKDSDNNDVNLTSINTHSPSLPLVNSWYYKNSQTTLTTSDHLSSNTSPYQTAWCYTSSSDCENQSMLNTDNTTSFTNNTASGYNDAYGVFSYGNFYNWYSATAGHGKHETPSDYNTTGDICPVGWHLPTGNTSGEFYNLNTYVNSGSVDSGASNTLRTYPNNFVFSGLTSNNSVAYGNSSGFYWSSTAYITNGGLIGAYQFSLSYDNVAPGVGYYSRYYGSMVRCVADS